MVEKGHEMEWEERQGKREKHRKKETEGGGGT